MTPIEDDQMRWLVLRHVAEHVECAACHHSIAPEEAQILNHHRELWFLRVTCERCGAESIIMVTVHTRRASEQQPALPDFSMSRQSRPIIESEIKEIHAFLENYRGNFSEWATDET